ncbi:hypothetical protein CY35_10G027400 [Sphagnum magellanicum]|nr:hypothetical protein CY35_10G027400 [Sphagnum magellanicum]
MDLFEQEFSLFPLLLSLSSSLEEEELVVRLQPRQVAVWFQNRRARWKTKQLERDYQVLTSDYNRLKTQLQAAIKEKQELQAKESTAAIEPSTLQQQLHPACSNDHAANDIQLMIKPESKLVVELSNNISCCRSADDVQIKNLHESARSSFLPDQDQVPSNCWTSRSKQLEYGSPISSIVASPSSEILDADSPRHIDSCTTLSQQTQVMDLKLLSVLQKYQNRGLQVYAAKPVNIDGSYISVHSELAHVAVVDVSESSTDPSISVLMVLTMAIPVAQISWSMLFPSRGSTAVAVVGQVLGWILGSLTLQLLATRYLVLGHLRELPGIDVMQAKLVAQTTWRWQEKTEMVGGAQYAKIWSNGCGC